MPQQQDIFDAVLDDALKVFRLAANQVGITAVRLEQLKKQLVGKLASEALNLNQRVKLLGFFKETNAIVETLFKQLELDLDLPIISETVAEMTANSLGIVLGGEALKLPISDYYNSVASKVLIQGAPSKDWWRKQSENMQFAFQQQVREGLVNGETNQQIISRIAGKGGNPGVIDIAKRNAAALVQTSVQAVANDARRATFDANSDIIKGIKQVSTLDGRTSLVCISYSGAEWNLKREPISGNTLPFNGGAPRHFNCRSLEIPITKTFRELGLNIDEAKGTTRASSEGPIDVNTSFDDFLTRKGKSYQNKMLGEGRADLWREGKITLKDLVDGRGRPVTLAELQKVARPKFDSGAYMKRFDDANVTPEAIIAQFPPDTTAKIIAVDKKLDKLVPTDKQFSKDGNYTADRNKLHNKILFEGGEGYDPDTGGTKFYPPLIDKAVATKAIPQGSVPTFTILGGRGGSGKSAFDGKKFPEAKVYDPKNVMLFDADAIKHMLPEFKGYNAYQVHEESSFILDKALSEARKYKSNVVLDGTLKTYETALEKIKDFKGAGYRAEAHYMHLPRQEAAKRAVKRFLGPTGRYVPAKVILSNTDNEINFDKLLPLVDNWSFRDNNVAKGVPPKLIAQKEGKK